MALMAVVQTAVVPHFPIAGFVPQMPFLIALAWGILHGPNEGMVWGFWAGLFVDLMSKTPLGSTAVTYTLAILLVTWAGQLLPPGWFFMPVGQSIVATLVFLLTQFLFLRLFRYPLNTSFMTSLTPLAFLHGVLILPVYWLTAVVSRTFRPRRIQI